MEQTELFTVSGDLRIRSNHLDQKPEPCQDCKKPYLVANSVEVRVTNKPHPVWEGCIDCWLIRTSPEMCATFDKEK